MKYNPEFLETTDVLNKQDIGNIEKILKNINFANILRIKGHKSALEKLCFDFIYTSAKIEGNSYTRGEATTLFEMNLPANNKKIDESIMLLNIKEAVEYALKENPPINKHTIREFHQILSQNLLPKKAQGGVRNIAVFIGNSDYIPLNNPQELEFQMDRMLEIYHHIENPLNKAIYIHNNIAYLQYFQDCNKRLARIMQNVSLLNHNLPFLSYNAAKAEQKESNMIKDYKDSIIQYYEKGDTSKYKDFFIKEYTSTLELIKEIQPLIKTNSSKPKKPKKDYGMER